MENWLRQTFPITEGGWETIDGTREDAFSFTNAEGRTVISSVPWFAETFGAAGVPPTNASLKAVDPANALGWHAHFDAWQAQGLID